MKFKRIDVATISVQPPIRSRDVSRVTIRYYILACGEGKGKERNGRYIVRKGKLRSFYIGRYENSRSPDSVIKLMERSDRRERSAGNSLSLSLSSFSLVRLLFKQFYASISQRVYVYKDIHDIR